MKDALQFVRDEAQRRGVTFMDARVVERENNNIQLQDGRADKVIHSKSRGLGVRVLKEGGWGFASTNQLDRASALSCLEAAMDMANASRERASEFSDLAPVEPVVAEVHPTHVRIDPRSVPISQKMEALTKLERAALDYGKEKLVNTVLSYNDSVFRETVCNTFGSLVENNYVRTTLYSMVTAQDGDVRQSNYQHKSKQAGYEVIEQVSPDELSLRAAKTAVALLSARRAPAGKFPVIFHPSITGLLTHEALGHNAEADLVLSGESIIGGKEGSKIASDGVTIVDDPTVDPASWGSFAYDSEGVRGQRRVLIENGVLKGYMHSLQTAARLGVAPNGSARAQDYSSRPIVRMSNTFIAPGESTLEEMLKDIDLGIYLKGGHWGYVFCERGQYMCHAGEGWMIRNGQLAEHLRDVSISGMTLETLRNVERVSKDFEMEMGGMCGKCGQGMWVNAGGPYVRVKELVVGGQE